MKRRVIWSPTSRADLIAIARYIASEDPAVARTVATRLRATGDALGERSTGRPGRVSGTYEKSTPKLPYVLAYELVSDGSDEAVTILHVIHTARNWPDEQWPSGQPD